MKIEFKNNKKIITHPSGVVSEYTLDKLNRLLDNRFRQRERIEKAILRKQSDIQKLS